MENDEDVICKKVLTRYHDYGTIKHKEKELEMELKMAMSTTKALKLAVESVKYHGSGMYSVSDDDAIWEYPLRAGSNSIIAIRNLRVIYAMERMFGPDGAVFTKLGDAISQPGTLREITKMARRDYENFKALKSL